MKSFKTIIVNITVTTGISIVMLSVIIRILLPYFDLYFTVAVFQTFGANIVIHLVFLLTRIFESKYPALEILLDIISTTIVLLIFGMVFNWFRITPIWTLIIMAISINLVALFLNMVRIKNEANIINRLLNMRNSNKGV